MLLALVALTNPKNTKKGIKKEEPKSPERKGVKKDTAVLKKERPTSEPPLEGKKIFNNIQLLSQALDDLYRDRTMTKSQTSEY